MSNSEELPFPIVGHLRTCKVRPAVFEGIGRGMRCIASTIRGEELLSVQLSKCWTPAAARASPELAELGPELLEAISDASLLALHMLVVKARKAEDCDAIRSAHLSMIEGANFETLLDWDDEELQFLIGSKWFMVTAACRSDIEEEFRELDGVIGDFLSQYRINLNSFMWAHGVVMSRAVMSMEKDGSVLYLIGPGHDMFNHSFEAEGNDVVTVEEDALNQEKCVVVRAYKNFAVGEQAFLCYNRVSNGRLLMLSGFVLPCNPYDAVELAFTFPVIEASVSMYASLAAGLKAGVRTPGSLGVEQTQDEFLEMLPPDDPVPREATLHVRLMMRSMDEQLERILAFLRLEDLCRRKPRPSSVDLVASDKDVSDRKRALERLKGQLASMLQQYPTSLQQDEAELALPHDASEIKARRKRMALQVLIGEKVIFKKALELLDEKLAQVSS